MTSILTETDPANKCRELNELHTYVFGGNPCRVTCDTAGV